MPKQGGGAVQAGTLNRTHQVRGKKRKPSRRKPSTSSDSGSGPRNARRRSAIEELLIKKQ